MSFQTLPNEILLLLLQTTASSLSKNTLSNLLSFASLSSVLRCLYSRHELILLQLALKSHAGPRAREAIRLAHSELMKSSKTTPSKTMVVRKALTTHLSVAELSDFLHELYRLRNGQGALERASYSLVIRPGRLPPSAQDNYGPINDLWLEATYSYAINGQKTLPSEFVHQASEMTAIEREVHLALEETVWMILDKVLRDGACLEDLQRWKSEDSGNEFAGLQRMVVGRWRTVGKLCGVWRGEEVLGWWGRRRKHATEKGAKI